MGSNCRIWKVHCQADSPGLWKPLRVQDWTCLEAAKSPPWKHQDAYLLRFASSVCSMLWACPLRPSSRAHPKPRTPSSKHELLGVFFFFPIAFIFLSASDVFACDYGGKATNLATTEKHNNTKDSTAQNKTHKWRIALSIQVILIWLGPWQKAHCAQQLMSSCAPRIALNCKSTTW